MQLYKWLGSGCSLNFLLSDSLSFCFAPMHWKEHQQTECIWLEWEDDERSLEVLYMMSPAKPSHGQSGFSYHSKVPRSAVPALLASRGAASLFCAPRTDIPLLSTPCSFSWHKTPSSPIFHPCSAHPFPPVLSS